MRWDDFRRSDNIEDRRGFGGGAVGGMGIGTVVVLGLIGWALGIDPRLLIGGAETLTGNRSGYESPAQPGPTGAPSDQLGQFVSAVLGDTEDRWKEIFRQSGGQYREPKLVIFSGLTRSACGRAQSAMGPFYCPNDQQIYLDTPYYVSPADKVSEEAFAVIRDAMAAKKIAGLARMVLYRRERPVLIEPLGKGYDPDDVEI